MGTKYQVMPELSAAEYAALKADIAQHGVLVPVELDENGDILDGHHRVRIWNELRVAGVDLADYPRLIRPGMTEEQKRNHARSLNALRRHLSKEQRDDVMRQMRADGMTYQQIADTVGVSKNTAHRAAADVDLSHLGKVTGADGKQYPASYERKPEPAQVTFEAATPAWKPPAHVTAEDEFGSVETVARPAPAIFAGSAQEERRAVKLAGSGATGAAGVMTVRDASDRAKESRRQERQQRTVVEAAQSVATLPTSVKLHHADSRDLLRLGIDPVHLVITSPPYNVGIEYATHDDTMDEDDYDDMLLEVFGSCHRLMVEGARLAVVVPFGVGRNPWRPFAAHIMGTLETAGFTLRGQIIWDKGSSGNRTSWGSFRLASDPSLRDTTEAIVVAHKGSGKLAIPDGARGMDEKGAFTPALRHPEYFMQLAQDHWVVAPESASRIGHPAPFPVELAKRLIDFYAYPGAHVLDPFGGSGTTGVAAVQAGCNATLVEIDAEYCRLAEGRLAR